MAYQFLIFYLESKLMTELVFLSTKPETDVRILFLDILGLEGPWKEKKRTKLNCLRLNQSNSVLEVLQKISNLYRIFNGYEIFINIKNL